jgi:NADH-ubiquinone oxidoreductase chain 2
VGTVVGLTQFRIKRLLAYSTISHVGFMLLALAVSSIESIQAFIFYIVQYSISNLNIFIILIAIGYSFYSYINDSVEKDNLVDRNNSPIQLVSQLRGFFYINPFLAISLAITIFSFVGVPPLIGFFGKQMVLSAALDKGHIFIVLIGIFTSVIGGVYYLNIVKETFFYEPSSIINPALKESKISVSVQDRSGSDKDIYTANYTNIVLSSPIAFTISVITLIILLFIFINNE